MYGYAGRILRINLTRKTWETEPLSENLIRNYLGGRGFNIRRLFDEAPAGRDGLSPSNPLIIGVGPLNGTLFPGAARFNVSAISPQTGILGDSNAGGFFGPELKLAGFDQVIIEGQAEVPLYLLIQDGSVQFRPAEHLWGLDVWQTDAALHRELGDPRVQVLVAGPAAEKGVKFAGLFANLVRAAARTGMGTVLAAKRVKAIAVRGTLPVRVADPNTFRRLLAEYDRRIINHPEYETRVRLGTTKLVSALNTLGALSTYHYQSGRFAAVDQVSGEALEQRHKKKAKGCFSCTIPCSRFFEIKKGPQAGLKSEGPEFEGLAGFTSKLGNADLATGLKAVDLCNRLGLDLMSTAEVLGFAMEAHQRGMISREEADGLDLTWGNGSTILTLIQKIARREGLGDLLADGVKAAAQRLGRGSESIAMHIKGLEFFMAEPRGIKGYALGLAVASRGGDHLRSEPSFEFSNDAAEGLRRFGAAESAFRLEYRGKGRLVKHFEELSALADALNACKNTIVNMEILSFADTAQLLEATTGFSLSAEEIQQATERIVNLERLFIAQRGITRADDILPARFLKEPLPQDSGPSAGSVVELEPMLDEYYEARGWDRETGLPTPEKLAVLGLL